MADTKEYLVEVDYCGRVDSYIVSAKNAKEAINFLYQEKFAGSISYNVLRGYTPILKKNLTARSLGSLHNESGRIIRVH